MRSSVIQKDFYKAMKMQTKHDYPIKKEGEEITVNHRRQLDDHYGNWMTLGLCVKNCRLL